MHQHVAAAVRYEWQQWHIQQCCQISTHAHTHVRARARAHTHTHTHTHRHPMGSQCFMAFTATCGSFTYHGMPCHAAHTHSDPGDPRRHTVAHSGTQHAMPHRPRLQRSRRPAAAHGGTRQTACGNARRRAHDAHAGPQLAHSWNLFAQTRAAPSTHQGPTRTPLFRARSDTH